MNYANADLSKLAQLDGDPQAVAEIESRMSSLSGEAKPAFQLPAGDYFGPMPAEAYHSDNSAWSRSMLNTFRERRQVAYLRYILKSDFAPKKKVTAAMDLGSLAHSVLLEPDESKTLFVEYPASVLSKSGARGTNACDAFEADCRRKGMTPLKADAFAAVACMAASARKTIGPWLDLQSIREHSIYWTNEDTGIRCKCRPDWIVETAKSLIVLDIKTTANADPAAWKFVAEGDYWLQQAHYMEGIKRETALPVEWYFFVLEVEPPFACQISRFDDDTINLAEIERLKTLRDLRACIDSGDWSEPWEKKINTINVRPWMINADHFNR